MTTKISLVGRHLFYFWGLHMLLLKPYHQRHEVLSEEAESAFPMLKISDFTTIFFFATIFLQILTLSLGVLC